MDNDTSYLAKLFDLTDRVVLITGGSPVSYTHLTLPTIYSV